MIKKHLFNVSKLNSNASKLALIAALSASSISYASTTSTYVGIDAVFSKMGFKQNYGESIFSKKVTPGLNVFVGHMFNENWGAEIGMEFDKKMKRTETIKEGEQPAGITVPTGLGFYSFNTNVSQTHPYIGGVFKTAVTENNFISLLAGVSFSQMKAKFNIFASQLGSRDISRTFSKSKPIAMIRATIEHKFGTKISLRGFVGWKNTSSFGTIRSKEMGEGSDAAIKFKNNLNTGIGVSYYI